MIRGRMDVMLKTTLAAGLAAGLVVLGLAGGALAQDEHAGPVTVDHRFSFEGPFGRFDQVQLQRGLQVYTEVCAACHGLQYVPFRELADQGGPHIGDPEMRAYAAMYDVVDPETGESRPGLPTDHFPPSNLPNAPDLSLMAKARAGFHGPAGTGLNQIIHGMGGAEYIASLLLGFTGEEREEAGVTLYENTAFGGYMAMNPVLSEGLVTFADGTVATEQQMAEDVAAFLMWTAEPKMMERKAAGLTAIIFMAGLTVLLYFTNKKIWAPHKRKNHA